MAHDNTASFDAGYEAGFKFGLRAAQRARELAEPPSVNRVKTHCPQGHPYDEANTRWYRGRRYCKACGAESSKRRKAAARSAPAAA